MSSQPEVLRAFEAISELEDARRPAALEELGEQAPDVAREVRTLLEAARMNDRNHFLEAPLANTTLLTETSRQSGVCEESADVRTLGHYEVIRRLAASATSTVYLARQMAPARRMAVVKVFNGFSGTSMAERRFLAENAAIARMQHPNIAQYFDSAVSEHGRVYFAMEYVHGLPITQFCAKRRLGIPDRLRLFIQVCEGVSHAHQRGVIHRDLKPSNILVAENPTGPGLAKVIDFGIAKFTEANAPDSLTVPGMLLGTLAYMSPEQLRSDSQNVSTQSDVFALGLVLYEVLSDSPPYCAAAGLKGIAGLQPDAPSGAMVSSQLRALGRDLASIILKATAATPQERYESVRELASDIERVLQRQPVLARRHTPLYVVSRFVRRHRSLCATFVVSLLLGGWAIGYAWKARNERASLALEVADAWLNEALTMGRAVGDTSQREPIVRRLLVEAQRLQSQFPRDARALSMLAAAYTEVGSVLMGRGKPLEAREHFEKALAIREHLSAASGVIAEAEHELSLALVHLGDAEFHGGDTPGAMDLYQRALLIDRKLVDLNPDDHAALDNLGWSYERMAAHSDDVSEMERYRIAQQETFERMLDGQRSRNALLGLTSATNALAIMHLRTGKPCADEAAAAARYAEEAAGMGPTDRLVVFAKLRTAITTAQIEADLQTRISQLQRVLDEIGAFVDANANDKEAVELWLHAIERARWSAERAGPGPVADEARRRFEILWDSTKQLRDKWFPSKSG